MTIRSTLSCPLGVLAALMLGLALLPAHASAQTQEVRHTKQGFPLCVTRETVDEMMHYVAEHDDASGEQLFQTGECDLTKGGSEVYVEDVDVLDNFVRIHVRGIRGSVWTVSQALY